MPCSKIFHTHPKSFIFEGFGHEFQIHVQKFRVPCERASRPSTVQTAEWRVERRSECSRIKRSKEVLGEPCYPDFKYIA